jgi:hypothetical protein
MKTLIFLLAFISATWPALGAITNSDRANIQATNRLSNGGFENGLSGWVTSGTAAGVTFGLDTTNFTDGLASFTFTKTGSASGSFIVTKDQATTAQLTGRNFEVTCQVENPFTPSGTPDQLCGRVNGVSTNCVTLPVGAGFQTVTTTIQPVTGDSFGAQVVWGNPSAGTGKIDECYVGPSRNIGTVQQALSLGSVNITGCAAGWTKTSGSGDFSTQSGCVYTTTGSLGAPSTNIPGFSLSGAPGDYFVTYSGGIGNENTAGSGGMVFQLYDGTNASLDQVFMEGNTAGSFFVGNATWHIVENSPFSNLNFRVQASIDGTATAEITGTTGNSGVFTVRYFPASAQQVYQASSGGLSVGDITPTSLGTCPIGTTLANGGSAAAFTQLNNAYVTAGYPYGGSAGTANLPDYRGLFIRGVGTNGTALQANGGAVTGAALGTLQNDMLQGHLHPINTTQSYASGGFATINSSSTAAGGTLATTPGALVSDGSNGTPRVGAETHPANLSATYCVRTVPASPAPILTNSITTNAAGAWRVESAHVGFTSSTCSVASGTGFATASFTTGPTCAITFTVPFSGTPTCVVSGDNEATYNALYCRGAAYTGGNSVSCFTGGTQVGDNFSIICQGPR